MKQRGSALVSSIAGPFVVRIRVASKLVALRLSPNRSEGGYVVTSSTLRGLNTQGETVDEAITNGREAALALLTEPRPRRDG